MTATDLAKWDISLIEAEPPGRRLVPRTRDRDPADQWRGHASTDSASASKSPTQRRKLEHGGEVSGFTAQNTVYPDERAAIVVLVNQDAARATDQLGEKLEEILFDEAQAADAARTAQARAIFAGLQQGQLDRGLFTANANAYFSDEAIADFKPQSRPAGRAREFKQTRHWLRGGMSGRSYEAKYADRTLRVWTYEMPDGKLEQFQVAVQE